MNTSENNGHRGTSQDTLNLRPLANRLGRNGPYIEGTGTAVERDCARIDGHSDLFRDLERFEMDLREAVERVSDRMTDLHVARQRVADGTASADEALDIAVEGLNTAFRYLQEGYLVAEVLDDRAIQRERKRETRDFLALVSRRPREEMSGLDRLAEEARLEWMISTLLDRMNEIRHAERREWPKIDREALERFNARLEELINPPSPDALQAMGDDELADELRALETRIRDTRKAITLIHAIKVVRDA